MAKAGISKYGVLYIIILIVCTLLHRKINLLCRISASIGENFGVVSDATNFVGMCKHIVFHITYPSYAIICCGRAIIPIHPNYLYTQIRHGCPIELRAVVSPADSEKIKVWVHRPFCHRNSNSILFYLSQFYPYRSLIANDTTMQYLSNVQVLYCRVIWMNL